MCGFFGIYDPGGINSMPAALLKGISASIRHRGPDDQGYFSDSNTTLTFNRLSIIDLTRAGHQPMSSPGGDIHLVFNGEIFNYIELRTSLQAKGHRFISESDTEVILHAYREYGVKCLSHFNGMWAFALYDANKKRIFCSRDRFGIKPFYYTVRDSTLTFASEIKALLKAGIKAEPDNAQVYRYLALGQLDVDDKTMFSNILQLPPAHFLVYEDHQVRIEKFWHLDNEKKSGPGTIKPEAVLEHFRELFFNAVNIRLRSDVPIGALLSGGLDSSAIVSVIHKLARENKIPLNIKTFTASYSEKSIDESHYAAEVVRKTGIQNVLVYPNEKGELWQDIEKVIYHQDEPPLTMTAFAHWYLMEEIHKQNIKVIISGQGADEMMAGYVEQFCGFFLADLLAKGSFGRFFHETQSLNDKSLLPYRLILAQLFKAFLSRNIANIFKSLFREKAVQHLEYDFVKNYWRSFSPAPEMKHYSRLNQQLYRAFTVESLPRILHYEDRNSMAFSIEQRVPFLDYRLVEFIFSLSNSQKMANGIGKVILRRALKGVMPDAIVNRYSKLGFTVPQQRWIQEMDGYVNDLFSSTGFKQRGFWDPGKIQKLYKDNREKGAQMDTFLWRVIACETWYSIFSNHKNQ